MCLSEALKKYNICSLHVKPLHVKDCLVIGNLYKNEDFLNDLDSLQYLSPIEIQNPKINFFSKYEVGCEEGVLALLLNFCNIKKDAKLKDFLSTLDIGYLSAESNFSEEEAKELSLHVKEKKNFLVVCDDLEFHPKAENIAKLLCMIRFYCEFEIIYLGLKEDIKEDNFILADEIEELNSFDGAVIYRFRANSQDTLFGSSQFALANRIKNNQEILIKTKTDEFRRKFKQDERLKGTIGLLPIDIKDSSYVYEISKITQVG